MKIYNSSVFATAASQGAGLVNISQVLTTTTIISPSVLGLNDTVRLAPFYKFNVTNIGDVAAAYKLTHKGAALATGMAPNEDQLLATPVYSADYAVSLEQKSETKIKKKHC